MKIKNHFLGTIIFNELFKNGPAAGEFAFILEYVKMRKIIAQTNP